MGMGQALKTILQRCVGFDPIVIQVSLLPARQWLSNLWRAGQFRAESEHEVNKKGPVSIAGL